MGEVWTNCPGCANVSNGCICIIPPPLHGNGAKGEPTIAILARPRIG